MKVLLLTLTIIAAQTAYSYEYRLQFTPASGALGLTVAGYQFVGKTIEGNCSYHTYTGGSGRGGRGVTTYHYNSCSWDLYGNLLSITPETRPLIAPPPLLDSGTELVYAIEGTSKTGVDTRGFGFVNTPSSHFTWETPSGYASIPDAAYTMVVTLTSDGDFPLVNEGAVVTTGISGTITPSPGVAKVVSSTCPALVPVGHSCTVTVAYNPKTIQCTPSAYGFAYTSLTLALKTNAGAGPEFKEGFTVTGVPICEN